MRTNKLFRLSAIILAMLMLMTSLCGCGKKITIDVVDMKETTQIETKTGKTVAEALQEAEITIGPKDETEPELESEITEDTTTITIKRYAEVTIVKDGTKYKVEMVGGTVEDALTKANLPLKDKETTDVDLKEYVTDGMTINIIKAKTVTLTADGKTNEVTTTAETVEGFLKEQKITLDDDDEVSEKLTTEIKDGMTIVVKRVEYKEETVEETIDFETETQYSDTLDSGTTQTKQEGVQGKKEVTYKVKYVDGKEDSKEVISEKVIKEAVNKIVVQGTKGSASGAGSEGAEGSGVYETHRVRVENCDGSGHGYYEIYYSDGSVKYEEF